MDDESIIALFFDRSEEAVTALDRKYGPICRRIASNLLPGARDAEECVSDAYLAAWNAIPPERPAPLSAWLFRVVRNLAAGRFRRETAGKRNSFYDIALDELAESLPSPTGVEDALDAKELGELIDRFLSGLDGTSRTLFLRRYWFGDRVEDIARAMGMSRNAVSVRLHRLRSRLRAHLNEEGYFV